LVEPGPSAEIHRTIKLGERPAFIVAGVAFAPNPSAALRYWNMARQRYCRRLARSCNTLRVSADPVAKNKLGVFANRPQNFPVKRDSPAEQRGFEPKVPR